MLTSAGSIDNPNFNNFQKEIILQAPLPMFVVEGPEFIVTIANEKNLEKWQRTQEEVLGKPLFEVFPKAKTQPFYGYLTEVYQTGVGIKLNEEKAEFYRSGLLDTAWFDIHYEPIKNEKGDVYAIMAISVEVTAQVLVRKKVENSERELQQMADALPHSEVFTRTVLESNPDCLKVIDQEGRIQYMNFNGQCLMEIDDFKKVKNKLWWELWGEENRDLVKKSVQKALSGETVEFIAQDLTAKGNLKWWDVMVSPVNNQGGEVKEILSISRDITYQKSIEEKIIETREVFERTLLNVPSAIYHFDKEGNILYANELAAYQMGYNNAEELLAEKNFTQFRKTVDERFELFDEKEEAVPSNHGSALTTLNSGKASEFVVKFINRKTKDSFWLLNRSVPLIDDNGNLTNIFTSCTDISEQKFAEEDVEESRRLLELTLHNVPSAIYHLDKNGNILYLNELAATQMGYDSVEEVLAEKNVYEFRKRLDENFLILNENGDILGTDESCTAITLKTSKPAEVVVQFISKKQKNSFWLLTKSVPLLDEKGELSNVFTTCTDITERKKNEESLKYRKALLEAQNEAIPDAILIVDANGEMVSMNKNFAKIWGMPDDIIAKKDDNAALEYAMSVVSDPEGFIKRVRHCYNYPEIKAHDEILLKDGRILDRYGNAVIGEDGTNYGWAWYFRDITEQKKSDKIIQESEEKYRGLFDKMDQGFCIVEVIFDDGKNAVDYRFIESNPVFKLQTGVENGDGKTVKELVPDIEMSWIRAYGKVVHTGKSTRFIDYSEALDRWFEVYAFRLGDNNKVAILFTNITERKKAELELKASEAKFKLLTETIPQMVWMTNEKGGVEYTSSQWLKYTGIMLTSDEDWSKISHPKDNITSMKAWEMSLQTGNKLVTEARIKSKEGEFRWHLSIGVPLKNDNGEIIKWIGSTTDIHDRKLEEQKKDEFISIASHEMKTPLTSAKAYLQLIEMTLDENDDAYLYTKKANDAVERLHKLISELLDASKIQHGKLNYTNSSFDFDMMIADTIENVQYSSVTHKITKRGVIKKQFLGDKDRLQQVIINLLTNAIKYSPNANQVTVEIQEQNNHLQVSIIDKGIGMPEKHLERVFERYYRVEEHSIQFQGLGIGLYISYDIIKRHDGKMWVESNLGEGSTFHFILPFVN